MSDAPYDVCICCARPWRLLDDLLPEYQRRPRWSLRRPDSVCHECMAHQGSDFRALPDHRRAWTELLEAIERAHAAEVARLKTEADAARRAFEERPEKVVTKYHDQEVLDEANARADRAFRTRERSWGALSIIRRQHREMDAGKCRCGERWDECPTAGTLRGLPHLETWERQQARRLLDYLPHGLPPDHPAVLDPRVAKRIAGAVDPYEEDVFEDEFFRNEAARSDGGTASAEAG